MYPSKKLPTGNRVLLRWEPRKSKLFIPTLSTCFGMSQVTASVVNTSILDGHDMNFGGWTSAKKKDIWRVKSRNFWDTCLQECMQRFKTLVFKLNTHILRFCYKHSNVLENMFSREFYPLLWLPWHRLPFFHTCLVLWLRQCCECFFDFVDIHNVRVASGSKIFREDDRCHPQQKVSEGQLSLGRLICRKS